MSYKLTTIAACRVARVDRQRFNEYVAGGDYPCAPDTVAGRSRLFDENDTIALLAFGIFIEKGMKPSFAGAMACKLLNNLRFEPEAAVLTFAFPIGAPGIVPVMNGTDPSQPLEGVSSALGFFETRALNVAAMRAAVRDGAERERAIIGPDD